MARHKFVATLGLIISGVATFVLWINAASITTLNLAILAAIFTLIHIKYLGRIMTIFAQDSSEDTLLVSLTPVFICAVVVIIVGVAETIWRGTW